MKRMKVISATTLHIGELLSLAFLSQLFPFFLFEGP